MSRTREGRQCSARTAPGWDRTDRSPAWVKVIGTLNEELWLELNKIGVWWCGWEVLEVVVEGAVGDVGGEGREGFLRGVALEVGDVVLGGVPYVFRGTQGRGRRVGR